MPKRIGIKTKKEDKKLTKTEAKEFIKCVHDVKYFIENYVYVQHPTKGAVKFELRPYQEKVLNGLLGFDKNIILQPRQSGKTITLVAYLLHFTIFTPDVTIGVAAHKGSGAKEIISRFRYAYENLPLFLKPAVESYNVFDIAFDNGSRILSQTTTESTYRGMSLSCVSIKDTQIIVRDKETGKIYHKTIEELINES